MEVYLPTTVMDLTSEFCFLPGVPLLYAMWVVYAIVPVLSRLYYLCFLLLYTSFHQELPVLGWVYYGRLFRLGFWQNATNMDNTLCASRCHMLPLTAFIGGRMVPRFLPAYGTLGSPPYVPAGMATNRCQRRLTSGNGRPFSARCIRRRITC